MGLLGCVAISFPNPQLGNKKAAARVASTHLEHQPQGSPEPHPFGRALTVADVLAAEVVLAPVQLFSSEEGDESAARVSYARSLLQTCPRALNPAQPLSPRLAVLFACKK